MKKAVLLFLSLSVAFLALTSCQKKEVTARSVRPVSVLVQNPERGTLEQFLNLSADVVSPKEVKISSDVPGKVVSISQYQGNFVSRNQTIALIDRFVIGATYAYAPARTPISGYVTTVYAKIGQSVAAGETIAVVSDINQLELDIYIPESSVADVKIGQTVKVSIPSATGQTFEAKISRMDLEVNPTTRTLLAKAEIDNSDRKLLPGMFSDVAILTRHEEDVIIVPNSAVFTQDEKSYVYLVDRGNLPADIRRGSQSGDDGAEGEGGRERGDRGERGNRGTQRQAGSGGNSSGGRSSGSGNNNSGAVSRLQEVEVLFIARDQIAIASGLTEDDEVIVFGREFLHDGSSIIAVQSGQ